MSDVRPIALAPSYCRRITTCGECGRNIGRWDDWSLFRDQRPLCPECAPKISPELWALMPSLGTPPISSSHWAIWSPAPVHNGVCYCDLAEPVRDRRPFEIVEFQAMYPRRLCGYCSQEGAGGPLLKFLDDALHAKYGTKASPRPRPPGPPPPTAQEQSEAQRAELLRSIAMALNGYVVRDSPKDYARPATPMERAERLVATLEKLRAPGSR